MIRWFANNNIAANFLMLAILLSGGYVALNKIPLEVQPAKTYSNIRITMSYRGGTAKDVEQSVLIPIESALEGIEGIQDISAYGRRDYGYLWIDIDPDAPIKEILEDVKSRVDGITTFPGETEKPRIYIPDTSHWHEVLSVAVTGNLEEYELRRVAQKVQDDLTAIDGISRVSMEGSREYEVSVEANQEVLDSYNLGFRDISDAIRRFSLDLPAGSIDSDSGTLTVRTRGQAYTQEEFGNIPIRAANGAEVLLRDVAKVDDGFGQERVIARFNGENCMFLDVMRTGNENAIEISNKVKEYVQAKDTHFPEGINIYTWND
ncbi:MAG: efflux RND transporter permease subunit, partial [Verrucomicrobiales bacterium]